MVTKNKNAGQILPIAVVLMTLLTVTLSLMIGHATKLHRKVRAQMRTDAVAISACRMQARALNALALLNNQLTTIETTVETIQVTWLALTACVAACTAATACPCHPAFVEYNRRAPKIMQRLRDMAKRLAQLQDRIIALTPNSVALFIEDLATDNHSRIQAVRYPASMGRQPLYVMRAVPSLLQRALKLPAHIVLRPDFNRLQRLQVLALSDAQQTDAEAAPHSPSALQQTALETADWDGKLEVMHNATFSASNSLH